MKKQKWLRPAVLALVFLLGFFGLQRLFMPKYMTGVYDGALISEYYGEEKNHQVVFVGDCEVYENFSPITLFEEYGIVSYIRGGPQQLIWQSYYLLEDTLYYETPDVVVFNVLSMQYDEPQSEAYNRLNIDGMRLSPAKIGAVQASMTEEESLLSYLLPILRYHDRWQEVEGADFRYYFSADSVAHNGYMMRNDVKPVGVVPQGRRLADYSFGEVCWEYLEKMAALCEEKGVALVLVKAPTIYPYWYEEWDAQIADFAEEKGLLYLNFLSHADAIGLDYETDTYDAGLHLNLAGAEKLSAYFGGILKDTFALADRREDSAVRAVWESKIADYQAMQAVQLAEIAQDGAISTYTYEKTG